MLCHKNVPWVQELSVDATAAHSSGVSKIPRFVFDLQIMFETAQATAVSLGFGGSEGGEYPSGGAGGTLSFGQFLSLATFTR